MLLDSTTLTLVLEFTLKSSLLFLGAALAALLLRRQTSALRHRIWCLAFAAAVCLPLLSLIIPRFHLPILRPATDPAIAPIGVAVTSDRPRRSAELSEPKLSGTVPAFDATDELLPSPHPSDRDQPHVAQVLAQHASRDQDDAAIGVASESTSTALWWFMIWATGCVLVVFPLLAGPVRHRWILSAAVAADDPDWQRELQECIERLGLTRAVRLFIGKDDTIPMTWGIYRPVVLLPSSCAQWNLQRRRVVLLHELAHIQRWDCPAQLVARVACAVYWFNPLAWYGLHRLRSECERACDDTVVNAGQRVIDYATELVDIAAAYRIPRMPEAVCMAGQCQLVERVASMLDPSRAHTPLTRRGALSTVLATVALLMAAAIIQPVARIATAEENAPPASDSLDNAKSSAETKRPTTDALGDPLPDAALLRMGTIRFRHPSSVVDMALSPDEKTVVSMDEEFIVWDAVTGKERWRGNTQDFGYRLPHAAYGNRAIVFAADSQTFYTPGRWNEIVAWNVATGDHEVIVLKDEQPEPRRALGHYSSLSIDITLDGQMFAYGNKSRLAVSNNAGQVLYDIANKPGNPIKPQDMNRDRLHAGGDFSYGRFSPDGTVLAVVNSESPNEIRLHEAKTGKELRRIPVTALLVRLAFSPDSKQIVATERDSAVRLYEVATGEKLWDYKIELKNKAESYTCAVAFSPDAETIAVCAPIGSDHDIHLLRAADGKRFGKLIEHGWKPWAVAFTADSKTLFSSGWGGEIYRWDVATQKQLTLPGALRAGGASAASPDGTAVAFCDGEGTVHVLDLPGGSERQQLKIPGAYFSLLTFSPDSRQLAGAGVAGDQVQTTVWDLAAGEVVHRWDWPKGHDTHSDFTDLCYSPDGQLLAAAVFRQDTGYIWNLTTGEQVAKLPHQEIHGLSFSPDNRTLVTAGWDKMVRFWSTETGKKLRDFNIDQLKDPKLEGDIRMHSVRYSPQSNLLATLHLDSLVRIWDADDLSLISEIDNVASFSQGGTGFSPDGQWYATGDRKGQVRLCDPLTGQIVWERGRHQDSTKARGFGGNGETLISSGDGVCYLWDLEPAELPLDKSVDELWKDLSGEDSPAAYRAIWALSKQPQSTVKLLGKKLRAVEDVVDMSRVGLDLPEEEAQRRKRLKRLMVAKKPGTVTLPTVQRAISLLVQIGTPEAVTLIQKLTIANNKAVNQSAKHALSRINK